MEEIEEYLNGWENPLNDMLKKLNKKEFSDVYLYNQILYPPRRKLRIMQLTKYEEGDNDYIFHVIQYLVKLIPPKAN